MNEAQRSILQQLRIAEDLLFAITEDLDTSMTTWVEIRKYFNSKKRIRLLKDVKEKLHGNLDRGREEKVSSGSKERNDGKSSRL